MFSTRAAPPLFTSTVALTGAAVAVVLGAGMIGFTVGVYAAGNPGAAELAKTNAVLDRCVALALDQGLKLRNMGAKAP